MLTDKSRRIRIGCCCSILTIPILGLTNRVISVLEEVIENDHEVPNLLFSSILLALTDPENVSAKVCQNIMKGFLLCPQNYFISLLNSVSSHQNDLVHSIVAEYLNSGTWEVG